MLAKWASVTLACHALPCPVAENIPKAEGTFQNGTVTTHDCPTEGSRPNEGSRTVVVWKRCQVFIH